MTKGHKGFTLSEVLITTAILTLITGAAMTVFNQSQLAYTTQNDFRKTSSQLRVTLDEIVRYIRQAGSDPNEALGLNPVEVLGTGHIRLTSDVTGSIASTTQNSAEATGDPDGALDSIYEMVEIRHDSGEERIYIDIGYGEQVLAERVTHLSFAFFDLNGNEVTDPSEIARVAVQVTGVTESADPRSGKTTSITLQSNAFIRSRTPEIVPE
ncbi:MAG TPA: prepilin-type N-terminal cleavage/methylation domain-containing protein [Acidobacteriota bacterium]|nr:prepilin-type N-terminal cleavage/methylation domain-containing protein [Acidobacteriota bacterium]